MTRCMLLLAALLALAALTACGQAASPLGDLLAGKKAPLTIVLKDMGPEWRTFRIQDQAISTLTDTLAAALATQGIELANPEYYTKGETLVVGTETYLIAYQTERKAVDINQLGRVFNGYGDQDAPTPTFLTADTKLMLSLLNQRTMGNVMHVKPVSVEKLLADEAARKTAWEAAQLAAQRKQSRNNLAGLANGLVDSTRYGSKKLPQMTDINAAVQSIGYGYGYSHRGNMMQQPDTKEPYRTNPLLSGKDIRHIKYPGEMILFYENTPQADGSRLVAFLDGQVRSISAADWPMTKKISRLPEPANENLTRPAPVANP